MILKEFMNEYRRAGHPQNFVGGKLRGPTQLETLLYEAGTELHRLRDVLTERTLAVRDAAINLGGKLLLDNIEETALNTCGVRSQVAAACDYAVMEFMSQRDHVKVLMKAVEIERNSKV